MQNDSGCKKANFSVTVLVTFLKLLLPAEDIIQVSFITVSSIFKFHVINVFWLNFMGCLHIKL